MGFLRKTTRVLSVPTSILAVFAGLWGWSFWWFFIPALITGVAMADQRIGIEDPLDVRNFIPGPRRDDFVAGLFAFGGSILGFGVMYLIGSFFA